MTLVTGKLGENADYLLLMNLIDEPRSLQSSQPMVTYQSQGPNSGLLMPLCLAFCPRQGVHCEGGLSRPRVGRGQSLGTHVSMACWNFPTLAKTLPMLSRALDLASGRSLWERNKTSPFQALWKLGRRQRQGPAGGTVPRLARLPYSGFLVPRGWEWTSLGPLWRANRQQLVKIAPLGNSLHGSVVNELD